jgi:hypothetical protein
MSNNVRSGSIIAVVVRGGMDISADISTGTGISCREQGVLCTAETGGLDAQIGPGSLSPGCAQHLHRSYWGVECTSRLDHLL